MGKDRMLRQEAALLVIDFQERLCAAMPPELLARVQRRTIAAITGARALGVPVVLTEQYPRGLGPTVAAVREAAGPAPVFEKLDFSAWRPEVESALGGRRQILLAGMETHVCVYQTARDVAEGGRTPYLLWDAVLSRTEDERRLGAALCQEAGGKVSSVETVLFDLLGRAGTAEFKAVSAAVK